MIEYEEAEGRETRNLVDANQLKDWAKFLLTYKFAIDEMETKFNILNEELQFVQQYNPIEHIKSRIKTPKSILDKLKRKQLDLTIENVKTHIQDIAGIRVICSFNSDIYRLVDMISAHSDIRIVQIKDYVKHPKSNGYQSLHLIVEIPVFLTDRAERVLMEIQIRTIAMDFWASLEHKIYYKFDKQIPDHIEQQLRETAHIISSLDERMLQLHLEVQSYK
ncbi:GTP pyrophosphokinase family protein [Paenibacillus allorhizosphaerae]|uniref:GTP pyrophosphokinase YwaC n=1 Tax=Paenibacillus allorhizosphaerae TaxID=2849866 RepID=A0ABM8VIG3_9BACL|nr:GTP pyrophosphokinase family protein [Paenibacillus allorhizosphaerae]CAG7644184.1 GTP pyrophosphokinase YwaC [Paenibacillus allorhizosphaerae]